MAAGRHGGYHDREFRSRETDIEVSRGKDRYYKEESGCEPNESGPHDYVIERNHNDRDRALVRQRRDIKENEAMNGGYRSSSSTSNSRSSENIRLKRSDFSVAKLDREPGELSSGSGSDDPDFSESHVRDIAISNSENRDGYLLEKKRKFSPIVWDREEKLMRNKPDPPSFPVSPPLLFPHSLPPSPCHNLHGEDVQPSPVMTNFNGMEPSPVKPHIAPGSAASTAAEFPTRLSTTSPPDQPWSNDQEAGQLDDEDNVLAMNISASRWAGENDSPRDEGELSDEHGGSKRRRKMPSGDSMDARFNKKAHTPVLSEFKREGSEGTQSKSSGSRGDGRCSVSARGDEIDLDSNDYMEVDEEDGDADATHHQTSTDSEEENDYLGTPELVGSPQRSINMLQGCRSVDEFERLNKIDEGTYGVVYRAKDKKTGEIVALKKVKMEKEREGFPLTSLREINILLSLHHPSIVDVKEVVVGSNLDSIFMVMEYMEHDLKGLMETMKQPFSQSEVKCLMLQLLEGIKYLHDNWVLHRDLKTSNLLLNNRGELKICDFGLARQYGSPLKPYTHLVVTLWYRAPELLLGLRQYSTAIDMWSLGCIMAELLAKEPLFNGKNEINQIDKIFKTIGTPNEKIWPGFTKLPGTKMNYTKQPYNRLREKFPPTSFSGRPTLSEAGFDLLNKLLTYDPDKRITAEAALNHAWFREVPLPKSKDFMPTFPAQHAQDRRLRRIMKSPDPLEELRRKELQQRVGTGGLFG